MNKVIKSIAVMLGSLTCGFCSGGEVDVQKSEPRHGGTLTAASCSQDSDLVLELESARRRIADLTEKVASGRDAAEGLAAAYHNGINAYHSVDSALALQTVRENLPHLRRLTRVYPDCAPVQQLISGADSGALQF